MMIATTNLFILGSKRKVGRAWLHGRRRPDLEVGVAVCQYTELVTRYRTRREPRTPVMPVDGHLH